MNIIDAREDNIKVMITSIPDGECFEYEGDIYVKSSLNCSGICQDCVTKYVKILGVNLLQGVTKKFDSKTIVRRLDVLLTING